MKTTITRGEEEIPLEVVYSISKGSRGRRGPHGEPEEPDDDPELEILSITRMDTGQEIELTAHERDAIQDECWSDAREEPDEEEDDDR